MDKDLLVQNIIAKCNARGEKKTAACIAAGVGKSFISSVSKGEIPSVEKILKLANYLGCSVDELLTGIPPAKPETPIEDEIMQKIKQLPEVAKAQIYVHILEMMAEQEKEKEENA